MKKFIRRTLIVLVSIYVSVCVLLYFFQEKIIFFPEKLAPNHVFSFGPGAEEMNIRTADNVALSGILFKAENTKGLIFYLHGNAGSLRTWGEIGKVYTDLGYDLFMLDYRGYGKSEGKISSEAQLFGDVQAAYNRLKKGYDENRIIVLGYSIGTGPAAQLASVNKPRMLILQAPYYSLVDMMKHEYPVIPTFLLKYKLETNEYMKACRMPVVIFHGDKDEVIYYGSSEKLMKESKGSDTLITLNGQGHNGITRNPQYLVELKKLLEK